MQYKLILNGWNWFRTIQADFIYHIRKIIAKTLSKGCGDLRSTSKIFAEYSRDLCSLSIVILRLFSWCRHECPKILLSDQGTPFCNELVDSLCKLMTIRHRLSSAYHPQTNGLTERFNKTLCNTLAKYVSDYGDTWDTFLNAALFAYRTV